jgi:hypothetical protein
MPAYVSTRNRELVVYDVIGDQDRLCLALLGFAKATPTCHCRSKSGFFVFSHACSATDIADSVAPTRSLAVNHGIVHESVLLRLYHISGQKRLRSQFTVDTHPGHP